MTTARARRIAFMLGGLAAVALVAGCAAGSGSPEQWWGDPETGIFLEYRMAEGEPLTYDVLNEQTQLMEVMGEPAEVRFDQDLRFTIVPGAREKERQALSITIEGFAIEMVTPQGPMSPPTDHLAGEGFRMALGPRGQEYDCENAEELTYLAPDSGEQNLSSQFCEFFPDLPDGPVVVGDTWESEMTIDEGTGDSGVTLSIQSLNTLTGFEEMDGHECARIESEFTGTAQGSGTQGPATITITGTIEGSGTWHFAYEEGLVVSDFSMGVSEGEVIVEGPQEMTIPTTREFVMESRLAGKGEESSRAAPGKPAPLEKSDARPVTEAPTKPGAQTHAGGDLEPDIILGGGFTVAGVRERFESMGEATSEAFEELWETGFAPHHDELMKNSTNKRYYGVSYGTGEGESFYYLAGMAVPEDAALADGLVSVSVPEGTFAVFETDLEGISETWVRAFESWLPGSGYEYDWSAPSYEEYPPDMGPDSRVLIFMPVAEKS
ncbi:MAG: hypothetical protein GF400_11680 [Candidatus Eisenbacteria bacterium]|nr:hypothetical protein [Candidatus Eisenbacteria bacterium]